MGDPIGPIDWLMSQLTAIQPEFMDPLMNDDDFSHLPMKESDEIDSWEEEVLIPGMRRRGEL